MANIFWGNRKPSRDEGLVGNQWVLLILLLLASAVCFPSHAQSVGHGADIDAQINGRPAQKANKKTTTTETRKPAEQRPTTETNPTETSGQPMKMVLRKIKVRKKTPEEMSRTKVTRGVHHEQGFRIQVFSGGNTRVARQEAERAGQKVKAALPNQPVYVHFYSPRWSCRVGNFRTYNSALGALRQIRRIGYKGAIIIRSVISVRDVVYLDDDYIPAMPE